MQHHWGRDLGRGHKPPRHNFLESLNSHFCCISYLLSNTGTRNSNFHNHCFRIPGLKPFSRNFQARKSQQFNSMSFQGMYEPWNGHSIINYDFLTLMMVEGGHFKQRMKRRSRLDIRQHVLANRVVDRWNVFYLSFINCPSFDFYITLINTWIWKYTVKSVLFTNGESLCSLVLLVTAVVCDFYNFG